MASNVLLGVYFLYDFLWVLEVRSLWSNEIFYRPNLKWWMLACYCKNLKMLTHFDSLDGEPMLQKTQQYQSKINFQFLLIILKYMDSYVLILASCDDKILTIDIYLIQTGYLSVYGSYVYMILFGFLVINEVR